MKISEIIKLLENLRTDIYDTSISRDSLVDRINKFIYILEQLSGTRELE